MNKILSYVCFAYLLTICFMGCDKYEVKEIPKSIYVDKESVSLFVGEQMQLTASPTDGTYNYQWTSEDPTVATVSNSGLVQTVGAGTTNIIVTGGNAKTIVPITSVVRIPLEDATISETSLELKPGDQKNLLVTLIPENANDVPNRQWISEDPDVARVTENGEVTAMSEGVTDIIFRAGEVEKRVSVTVSTTRPFNGPHIISVAGPLHLYAADFDFGGEGYAFHDADATNPLNNDDYRRGKGDTESFSVEIEGDGTNIGYINADEWWQYTVHVQDAGEYWLDVALSAAGDGKFRIEIDGVNVTGTVDVPNNGSWADWRFFPNTPFVVNLTQGTHKVKFYTEQSGFNLRGMRFVKK
ncbi:hypothetical protein GCM10011386_00580 [Parapedobacter defluvii]|uniref:CBM6 domain-containing protein n=1 Tax=Parapedobacter defluvii TaxID=2045106 RepID=A0ABQ1KWK3_9SPHI|nr:Ig-like domain-containing protein [Parapedobacter defluvii]GGC12827.1 hypothetical protein GCM10011386_00580 [Parapedobacter defluvii]